MKKLSVVSLILLFMSCSTYDRKWAEYATPSFQGNSEEVYLEKGDSVEIRVPDGHYNVLHNCQIYRDSILYAVSLSDGHRVSLYNIGSGTFMYDILVDKNTTGVLNISNFNVVSPDSIFFTTFPKTGLVLLDSKGRKQDIWQDDDMEIPAEMDPVLSSEFAFANMSYLENFQYDKDNNLIYAVLSPFSAYDETGDPDVKRHEVYNIVSRKWEKVFAPYEGVLKYKGDKVYFYDMHHPYQTVLDGKVYVTYPVDHRVYIYDLTSGNLTGEKDISPSCAGRFSKPFDPALTSDDELNRLRRTTAYYGPLYYHPDVECFSRFYLLGGVEGRGAEKAVIIYDKNFNIVYEQKFKANEVSRMVPADDGFLTIPYDPMNADTFTFVKYKICWK